MSSDEVREVYKITVEMADRVSARRGQANQFYLTIETLLLGIPTALQLTTAQATWRPTAAIVLAVLGIAVSAAWWLQLRSYRDLNAAKFAVINRLEADHFEVSPFSDEWTILKKDPVKPWRRRYAELGTIERALPVLFAVMYVVSALIGLL
jgi:hypothetical protein